jgi:hypothetical protein
MEADEWLDHYYKRIWQSCSQEEKLVLVQIADEGLSNVKSARVIRLLMARGLVTKRRNIKLVTETFRRFVQSEGVREEALELEGRSTGSWDAVRLPFMTLVIASIAFFFTTQHELFTTTMGIVTGVAASLPAVLKVASLFGGKRADA